MTKHTPRPYIWLQSHESEGVADCSCRLDDNDDGVSMQLCALHAAAPELKTQAEILRCLATSPRFQNMTVAEALREMKDNAAGYDNGAAITKAEGR